MSFVVYARPDTVSRFTLRNDPLVGGGAIYDFSGRGAAARLRRLRGGQEFWHSWRAFQPKTRKHTGG